MAKEDYIEQARRLGPELAEYSRRHDEDGTFVEESFQMLKSEGYFAAMVPKALGGRGATLAEMCAFIRELAHHCPSTSLAFSMHTHLVAATVFKVEQGQPGEALLTRVQKENLILVSTGAGDWLESNGTLEKVEGGFEYTSKKPFASGSPLGSLMITSGRYEDPVEGPRVLHFPLALSAPGVTQGNDWDTLGMRGTGSNTVHIERAFVPDAAIALNRPRGPWHPAFDVTATLALPILMSPYVGVAEHAVDLALDLAKKNADDTDAQYLAGELMIALARAHALFEAHIQNAQTFAFSVAREKTTKSLQLKAALAQACLEVVEKAMETGGGKAFFRDSGIEQCLRDVHGAAYHPYQAKRAARFCGRIALGLDPGPSP